jgi:hypothetical protein
MQTDVNGRKWPWIACLGAAAVLFAATAGLPGPVGPEFGWVLAGCRYACWACGAWVGLVVLLGLLARAPGGCGAFAAAVRSRVTPRFVRRALGLGVGLGLAAPGAAWALPPGAASGTVLGPPPLVVGLDWPTGPPPPPPSPAPAAAAAPPAGVDWPESGPLSGFPSPSPVAPLVAVTPPAPAVPIAPAAPVPAVTPPAPAVPPGPLPVAPPVTVAPAGAPPAQRPVGAPPAHPGMKPGREVPAGPGRHRAPRSRGLRAVRRVALRRGPAGGSAAGALRRSPDRVPDSVLVRAGDTLWGITQRWLGPRSGPAEIARQWPRWYAANRAVIGPNPDLILPGERLVPPATN